MAIEWLKRKHRVRKPTQDGYRRPADGGDQGRKHLSKHKANEAQRAAMKATQPAMVMVLDKRGRIRMRKEDAA